MNLVRHGVCVSLGMVIAFSFAKCAGQARFSPRQPTPPPDRIEIHCSEKIGTLRHMLGVNNGPRGMFGRDFTRTYREMCVDFVRTHDFYGPTDLHEIFPDWKADPTDPKSYRFKSSDARIKPMVEGGFKVLFRLGESWERPPEKYNVPPPDFEKCAEVCRRIVMHYNQGWADGFHFGIKYWEIWNEPDIRKFWTGTPQQFYRFYELVAKKLKKHDPTLKVGGPASTGGLRREYLEDFLKYVKEHDVPLDFYSWHFYGRDAQAPQPMDKKVRAALTDAGFPDAESICDEWNWALRGPRIAGEGNAAFTAAALIAFQDTSVSIQTRYRGDDHPLGMLRQDAKMRKSAYAYKAMGMMLGTTARVRVTPSSAGPFAALAGLSADGKKLSILIADYSTGSRNISVRIRDFVQKERKADLTLWVLDSERDLEKVASRHVALSRSFTLDQKLDCPMVRLLQLEVGAPVE